MPSLDAFLAQLDSFFSGTPDGYQFAVEIRNPNYLSTQFFDLLGRHGIGNVFLEGYHMPHIGEVWDPYEPTTTDFAVIRLHGSDRLDIEQQTSRAWDHVVDPKPEALSVAARIVRADSARNIRTFVNVNNHFEGSAPLTIERLLAELDRDGGG
jgi:uncharacterized protein YecE (DUF72 family)